MKKPLVGILMGSASDKSAMEEAAKALEDLGVAWEMRILSAHRTP
ncbi:MAG: AIR carboxylase family protein, partial [bacterium]